MKPLAIIPEEFVREQKPVIRRSKSLPFVAGNRTGAIEDSWCLPATGGSVGGFAAGEALAIFLLKRIREQPFAHRYKIISIAEAFSARLEGVGGRGMANSDPAAWTDEYRSIRGQFAGFMKVLHEAATAYAVHADSLDLTREAALIRIANQGVAFDEPAYEEFCRQEWG